MTSWRARSSLGVVIVEGFGGARRAGGAAQ